MRYILKSTPLVNTPGYVRWAINDYRPPKKGEPTPLNPDRLRCIHLFGAAFPDLPFGVVADVVDRKATTRVEGEDFIIEVEGAPDILSVLKEAVAWADRQDPDSPADWQTWAFNARAVLATTRS